jgi:hypothetical protein
MVPRLDIATVSKDVRIAVGKDDNVPGRERDLLTVLYIRVGLPMREQVIDDHVPGLWRRVRRHETGGRCVNAPRR